MAKKTANENQKTYSDFTNKMWFVDNDKIKIGETMPEIMSGKVKTIDVKEILVGETYQTWKIVIDKEDKIYLLKTSRELK